MLRLVMEQCGCLVSATSIVAQGQGGASSCLAYSLVKNQFDSVDDWQRRCTGTVRSLPLWRPLAN